MKKQKNVTYRKNQSKEGYGNERDDGIISMQGC